MDVVKLDPVVPISPLLVALTVVLTLHVGSRTYESVERQVITTMENTLCILRGQPPHA